MLRIILLALLIVSPTLRAADAPASEATIREILAVTDARKMMDTMFAQFEGMMLPAMQQSVGRALNTEEQKIAATLSAKMMAMMREELSWEKVEALYIKIYQSSFTQEEVDGMLTFYKSPAGMALIKKMPVVLQQSMAAMQERMGPIMQKVQQAIQETAEEMKKKT